MNKSFVRFLLIGLFCVAASATVSAAEFGKSVASEDALAFLKVDIERQPERPGPVVSAKIGYEWKLFKGAGMQLLATPNGGAGTPVIVLPGAYSKFNKTEGGVSGEVGIGWNFGPRIPLTLGVNFGMGPAGEFNTIIKGLTYTPTGGVGPVNYDLYGYQKLSVYTFDFAFDYEFRNTSRWTPFVGAIVGVALVSDKGNTRVDDKAGVGARYDRTGSYDTKRSWNFMGGARLGVKYDINQCVQLSLFGSYTYLGQSKGRVYNVDTPTGGGATALLQASTNKAKIHALDVKAGIRIMF